MIFRFESKSSQSHTLNFMLLWIVLYLTKIFILFHKPLNTSKNIDWILEPWWASYILSFMWPSQWKYQWMYLPFDLINMVLESYPRKKFLPNNFETASIYGPGSCEQETIGPQVTKLKIRDSRTDSDRRIDFFTGEFKLDRKSKHVK